MWLAIDYIFVTYHISSASKKSEILLDKSWHLAQMTFVKTVEYRHRVKVVTGTLDLTLGTFM